MRNFLTATAIGGIALTAASANAALTFSFDEAAFAAGSNVIDDFSAYAAAGDPTVDILSPTVFGAFQYTPIGSTAGLGALELRSGISSAADNQIFAFLDGSPDNFSFSVTSVGGPLNAFGFDVSSGSSFGGTTVTLNTGDTFNLSDFDAELDGNGTGFLGFASDTPFTSIRFDVENDAEFEGVFFNTFYADVVPAPGAAGLLGLAGLAAVRRRR